MNIFAPYVVVEDTPLKLHLKESNARKNFIVIVFALVPFVYLIIALFLIFLQGRIFPDFARAILVVALVIPAILMLTRELVLEVTITRLNVDVVYNVFLKRKTISYPVAFIDEIYYRRRGGKAPAYIYYAVMKGDNKKYQILSIRSFYMTEEKQLLINNKIQTLTGLQVATRKSKKL